MKLTIFFLFLSLQCGALLSCKQNSAKPTVKLSLKEMAPEVQSSLLSGTCYIKMDDSTAIVTTDTIIYQSNKVDTLSNILNDSGTVCAPLIIKH